MDVTLPTDLTKQVEQELACGRFRSSSELIEQAVRQFFDERQRGQQRLDALRGTAKRSIRPASMSECRRPPRRSKNCPNDTLVPDSRRSAPSQSPVPQ